MGRTVTLGTGVPISGIVCAVAVATLAVDGKGFGAEAAIFGPTGVVGKGGGAILGAEAGMMAGEGMDVVADGSAWADSMVYGYNCSPGN